MHVGVEGGAAASSASQHTLRSSFGKKNFKKILNVLFVRHLAKEFQKKNTLIIRGNKKKIVEMRGIDPRASRMLSERSTI